MRAAVPLALAFALWAITAPGSSTGAIPSADARFERLSAAVVRKMEEHGVPGAALGVLDQGRIATRGFGVTSIDNPLPVTEETLFQARTPERSARGRPPPAGWNGRLDSCRGPRESETVTPGFPAVGAPATRPNVV